MSSIPGLERPAPVPNEQTKPFWDACNERRLVLQNCTACQRLHYPPTQKCSKCGSADKLEWKAVEGKGHIDVYFVIRDSRIRGFRSAQPINFALITLDQDPGINFLSNLPGTPPGEVPVGAPVEVMFEQTSTGQLIPEWRVLSPAPRGGAGRGSAADGVSSPPSQGGAGRGSAADGAVS